MRLQKKKRKKTERWSRHGVITLSNLLSSIERDHCLCLCVSKTYDSLLIELNRYGRNLLSIDFNNFFLFSFSRSLVRRKRPWLSRREGMWLMKMYTGLSADKLRIHSRSFTESIVSLACPGLRKTYSRYHLSFSRQSDDWLSQYISSFDLTMKKLRIVLLLWQLLDVYPILN